MKRNLLSFALLFAGIFAGQETYAQCNPVSEINENFNSYSNFSESCWTASEAAPMITVDGDTEKYVSFYSSMAANTPVYLVTPEIVAIDGTQTITFYAYMQQGSAPGNVTIQLGTLSTANGYENFTAVGNVISMASGTDTAPESYTVAFTATDDSYIAFQITADGQHVAAAIDNVVFGTTETTCEAQETLDENFDEASSLTDICWSANEGSPIVYVDGETNQYISFYSSMSANTAGYLVTPELSTIDGQHALSFETMMQEGSAPGNVTIQIGTLSDATNFETFSAVGDPITVPAEVAEYSVTVPATTDAYIAFQIIADGQHVAAAIDNVKWQTILASDNFSFENQFSFYPNPSVDKNITIVNNTGNTGTFSIYSLTGAKVFETEVTNNSDYYTKAVNLSSLTSGIYIVQMQSGNYTQSKKLVIR